MEYKGWTEEIREETIGDSKILIAFFTDENGNDWYELVNKIDLLDKFIIGVNQDNTVRWFDTTARAKYSPPIGGKVVLLSELPEGMSLNDNYKYEDGKFIKSDDEIEENKPRTKDEILGDLMKLKQELESLT